MSKNGNRRTSVTGRKMSGDFGPRKGFSPRLVGGLVGFANERLEG